MQIVHAHEAQRQGASAHRPGGIGFVSLLRGTEDTAGNYQLALVEAHGYSAPRHRHNFDQVRIVLEGAFGYDRGMTQPAGTLGYFPEGTYYTQSSEGRSLTLLLQAGGPAGHGYMSDRQLRAAVAELQAKGHFDAGVYTWHDAQGKKHNKDGYEAAWEHVRGRPIVYPKPCFDQPVLWQADRFPFIKTDQTGVERRDFAQFTSGHLGISEIRLAPGAQWHTAADAQEILLCQFEGSSHAGKVELQRHDSLSLSPGEGVTLTAGDQGSRFYEFLLMRRAGAEG